MSILTGSTAKLEIEADGPRELTFIATLAIMWPADLSQVGPIDRPIQRKIRRPQGLGVGVSPQEIALRAHLLAVEMKSRKYPGGNPPTKQEDLLDTF